jgi:hypothetical protein
VTVIRRGKKWAVQDYDPRRQRDAAGRGEDDPGLVDGVAS